MKPRRRAAETGPHRRPEKAINGIPRDAPMGEGRITVLGTGQAKEGFRFLFEGPPEPCRDCEFLGACLGRLEPGRIYRVTSVKRKKLPCGLHGGEARVVEVEESCVEASLESRLSMEGASISYRPIGCGEVGCELRALCSPLGLRAGDRCKILSIGERLNCPIGLELRLASLLRQPSS